MKKYFHLVVFAIIAILIAGTIYAIHFFYVKIQTSLDLQEQMEVRQEVDQSQIANLPQLGELYKKINENERYFALFYREDQVIDIIKNIEALARDQGVTLVINQKEPIKPPAKVEEKKDAAKKEGEKKEEKKEPPKPKTILETLPPGKNIHLELRATGSYSALRNFLLKLETSPYALDVLSLDASIAPPEEEGAPTTTVTNNENPFLLQGNVETTNVPKEPPRNRIVFLLDTALYVK